jgi:hypothetical protein
MLPRERGRIQKGDFFILLAAVVFMLRFTEVESSRYSRCANSVMRSLLYTSPESCIMTERHRFANFVGMHVNGSDF